MIAYPNNPSIPAKKVSMPVGMQPPPIPGQAPPNPQVAQMDADRSAHYDKLRQRAQQEGNTLKQTQGEALKRRFAALGNINSGAYIKAAGLQDQEIDKQTQQGVENVEMQQSNEKFQSNEAEKGRIFNRELFDKDASFKQMVFADESKYRGLDFEMSKQNSAFNAASSLSNLDEGQLRTLANAFGGGTTNWGDQAISTNLQAILKGLRYR